MKIIVILTLSISLFSYSFIRIDAVNAWENEVGTVDYEALAHRSKELDPVKNPDEVIALLEPHKHSKDNKSYNFYNNLGLAYKNKGRFKEAISAYVRSLELVPHQPRALYNLGIVYYKNDELSKALKYFLKSAEQRPGHSNTKKWIVHLENKLARPAPEESWNTPAVLAVLFFILFLGVPVGVYIVLQIRAIYRTRGVWRICAILAVAPAAFILYIFAMGGFAARFIFWFFPLWFLMSIVYFIFLHTKFIPQRQKLTFLKCPKCDNEIRNPLEKDIPKGKHLEITCPKCHFSFNID